MSERFRALLDDAVSDLEPANRDPVPAIVGRGRAARRRAVGAAALALAVLAGSTVIASDRLVGDAEPASDGVAAEPPTPRLVGDAVMAGDLRIPVPAGWRVVVADPKAPCVELKDTVLIIGPDAHGCQHAAIEVSGTTRPYPPGMGMLTKMDTAFTLPPNAFTLRGGAPAWLLDAVSDDRNNPRGKAAGYSYWNRLVVPWSKVEMWVRVPGQQQQQIFDSISVIRKPRTGRLTLQDTVAQADLVLPQPGGGEPYRHGSVTDAQDIDAVLQLLRAQKATVDGRRACTSQDQPTARLTLRTVAPPRVVGLEEAFYERSHPNPDAETTSIIISLGDCREAVSSKGGRVRLSQATIDELAGLFGIAAR